MSQTTPLNQLVDDILASPKYRGISRDLVLGLAQREMGHWKRSSDLIKAVRNRLHQMAGAYFDARPHFSAWQAQLEATANESDEALRSACRTVMLNHASTRERLPLIERFYTTIFAHLPPITSLLDLACGLNPLARLWMPIATDAIYYAYDLYAELVPLLDRFFALAQVAGQAGVCDLLSNPPSQRADVALLLKTLPVLEQAQRGASHTLLRHLDVAHIVVSFPDASLGGRKRGLSAGHEAMLQGIVEEAGWRSQRVGFAGEVVVIVNK